MGVCKPRAVLKFTESSIVAELYGEVGALDTCIKQVSVQFLCARPSRLPTGSGIQGKHQFCLPALDRLNGLGLGKKGADVPGARVFYKFVGDGALCSLIVMEIGETFVVKHSPPIRSVRTANAWSVTP